ncbi:putative HNHc nuclease [Leuconostoc miyukkimchii]|uniref:putative HNHc nuclease n=1 Tax=Leuconostoc miyukkimchii TaxID=910540 RepID=UPI001C7D966A|nr:putative HNHc nuclease [Leuconostoc miyukkimchii]
MPREYSGKAVSYDGENLVINVGHIEIDWQKLLRYNKGDAPKVELVFDDQQRRSLLQNKHMHAIISDIANWQGEDPEEIKMWFKWAFANAFELDEIKTSRMSMEQASAFISMLITFALKHGVALVNYAPLEMLAPDDVAAFEYQCLIHKRCVICGKHPSDLHHLDTVGANGGNRGQMNHLRLRAVQLCREHHQMAGQIGVDTFLARYHLTGIKIDEDIAKIHKLNMRSL